MGNIVVGHLVQKHKRELTKDLSAREFLLLNFVELNRKAVKLAEVEFRSIQKNSMINI